MGELTEEEIADKFPDEHLMILKAKLNDDETWYADYVNYIVEKVIYKERTKKWHDSKLRRDTDFKIGDKVLLFNSLLRLHLGKQKSKWSGPLIVKTVYPYGAVEITDKNGSSFKVNGQRLKKYYDGSFNTEDNEFVELDG
ncbi:hypothetical protein Tco_0305201 [Tanacetum coccineum]